ncbi:BZ3500_MvSof-1268-A1-R1_Chr11-1g03142 [Microbotryum saponariae]|uniref:BZ3500_MvSof-1268-A1-R1_Chr11-1g03142 protein n=1 Tax=Microbotryum saponariae TaxID=289078 RepID=A0A2X0N8N7_9BASI|nr:BZ3501_MvSof-1269-A2-R1_Chr11g02717 [Microbotryum saponariae]SDA03702.1 BZ3500_MvSof-1268-A1-R1_Chr11-1g03142 [Microbotryum saponariae]
MATSTIEEFDRSVRQALTKSLSHSRVEAVVESAMLNVHPDTPLVASILRHHRKATAPQKLPSLYLVDAIAREARKRVKRALQEQSVASFEPSTSTTSSATPDYAAFMTELEAMLAKIVLDSWENGEHQHREKVRKILEIWQKGGVFSSSSLSRINAKMAAFDQQGASGANGSAPLSTSTTPPQSPPPRAYTDAATQGECVCRCTLFRVLVFGATFVVALSRRAIDRSMSAHRSSSAPSGLPASVLALFGAQSGPTSTLTSSNSYSTTNGKGRPALSIQDEVARAIAGAKSGTFLPNEPTPPPPPAIASSIVPPPPTPARSALPFNASRIALNESLAKPPPALKDASRSTLPPPALHSPDGPDSRNNQVSSSLLEPSSSSPASRPLPSFPSTTANPSLVAPPPPPPPPGFKPPIFLPTPQVTPSPAPPLTPQPQPQPHPSPNPSPAASFDPTTFSALSAHSWTSLVASLRSTLFAHLTDREPTNGEVMAFVQMVTMRQQQQHAQQQMMMSGIGFARSGEVGTANTNANGHGHANANANANANGFVSSAPTSIVASSSMQTDYDNPTSYNHPQAQDEYSGAWPSTTPF